MKEICVALFIFCSVPAWAEWVQVSKGYADTLYMDRATLKTNQNIRKIWLLTNYARPLPFGSGSQSILSDKTQYEFDCQNDRFRMPYVIVFREGMGNGQILSQTPYEEIDTKAWVPVAPGSNAEAKLKFFCSL